MTRWSRVQLAFVASIYVGTIQQPYKEEAKGSFWGSQPACTNMTRNFVGPILGCRQPWLPFGAIASMVVLVGLSLLLWSWTIGCITDWRCWLHWSSEQVLVNIGTITAQWVLFGPLLLSVWYLAPGLLIDNKEEEFTFGKARLLACWPIVVYGVCVFVVGGFILPFDIFCWHFWLLACSTHDVWKANVFLYAFYRATRKSAAQWSFKLDLIWRDRICF